MRCTFLVALIRQHALVRTVLWQLFCEELRPQLVAQHPKAGMPELSRMLAAAWREASAEDKAAYAAMREVGAADTEVATGEGFVLQESSALQWTRRIVRRSSHWLRKAGLHRSGLRRRFPKPGVAPRQPRPGKKVPCM